MMNRFMLAGVASVLFMGAAHADVRVIIEFSGAPDAAVVTARGGVVLAELGSTPSLVALVPPQALPGILRNPNVVSIEEDVVVTVAPIGERANGNRGGGSPTPPPAQRLDWGVDRIDAEKAWSTSRGRGVNVHINDTGIDNLHADFKDASGISRVILGPNFNNPSKSSRDDNGHGSNCAGIAGASDNTIGAVGVANECTLTAVKTLDRNGSGWLTGIVQGIDWSVANGAHVISMSLGSTANVASLENACNAAVAAGVVVTAAAGNEAQKGNPIEYPGAYASVICVGATDSSNNRASFSNYGTQVDIVAPGVSIFSTYKNGTYATLSGTSMATPHVAGAAAQAIGSGRFSDTNGNGKINDEVRASLEGTADDLGAAGYDIYYGNGLLDAEEVTTGVQTP